MEGSRLAAAVSCGLTAGAFLLLGVLWAADRGRRWEEPHAEAGAFVVLKGGERPGGPLAMIAVHPGCPACVARLAALRDSCAAAAIPRDLRPAATRPDLCLDLVVLLVDQPDRPSAEAVASLGVDRIWWDRAGTWRHRWGHRLYGETLLFDGRGRHLETIPAPERR